MTTIRRDPAAEDHTIWTAVAPDLVFTVRTNAITPPQTAHPLVSPQTPKTRHLTLSPRYNSRNQPNMAQVRSQDEIVTAHSQAEPFS